MAYNGITAEFPCGQGGFNSNQNNYIIPVNQLVRARNIRFDGYTWRKVGGLGYFDVNAISGTPTAYGGTEYRVDDSTVRQVTAWSNGKIYKEVAGDIDSVEIETGLTLTHPVIFIEGGQIQPGEAKKLFVFTRGTEPQYIDGDGSALTSFTGLSLDWDPVFPGAAIYHDSRLLAFDHTSFPHNFYASSIGDQSEFRVVDTNNTSTGARIFTVAPGKSDRIAAMYSLVPTVLYIFKYPRGIYKLDTTDWTNSYIPTDVVRDDVGMAGPLGVTKVGNDVWFIGSNGRIYSLAALEASQDPKDADISAKLQITEYIKENVDLSRLQWSRLIYNEYRRELWYTFTSKTGDTNDSVLVLDLDDINNIRAATDDRGAFFNAVWPRIQSDGAVELLCAGEGGLVYRADRSNRAIGTNTAYTGEFWYPDTDLGYVSPALSSVQKRFDMVEFTVVPTGDYDLTVEIYVDGESYKTVTVNLGSGTSVFDESVFDTAVFGGQRTFKHRVTIGAVGTYISFRCYNSALNEDFNLANIKLFCRPLGNTYEI